MFHHQNVDLDIFFNSIGKSTIDYRSPFSIAMSHYQGVYVFSPWPCCIHLAGGPLGHRFCDPGDLKAHQKVATGSCSKIRNSDTLW